MTPLCREADSWHARRIMGSVTRTAGSALGKAKAPSSKRGKNGASEGRRTKANGAPAQTRSHGVAPARDEDARAPQGAFHPAIPPPAPRTARLAPVKARPSRSERAIAEARAREIDEVCAAWAAIVAERMAADQAFAEAFEQYQKRPRDLRGLFVWDALHAAESHLALVNAVLARHLDGRRADPFEVLADLRAEQRRMAVVYAVNAFLAVLNQMSPNKPRWLPFEDFDPRMAVLALAHQSLVYALEAARVPAPPDLTEHILQAAQDESVWTGAREAPDRTLAACAAAAAFFRALGADGLGSVDEIVALYETRAARAG